MPSKIQIAVLSFQLMPAQTCTSGRVALHWDIHRCQPSRIWRLCPLSRPESAIYLKCPGFSRLLLLSWDNRVQTSSTTLELWLESLNHVSFMHSAALSIATINSFAVLWVGLSSKIIILLSMRRKHLPSTSQETVFFVPEIILWRLSPMDIVHVEMKLFYLGLFFGRWPSCNKKSAWGVELNVASSVQITSSKTVSISSCADWLFVYFNWLS